VGGVLGLCLIVCLVVIFILWRKKTTSSPKGEAPGGIPSVPNEKEVGGGEPGGRLRDTDTQVGDTSSEQVYSTSGDVSSPREAESAIVLGGRLRYPDDSGTQPGGRLGELQSFVRES
jgi:hypothetical protein